MECECADGTSSLYWLPSKFSKVVWAQRGDFLIVEPDNTAAEASRDSKITCTIVQILFPEQVAHLRKLPCWPEGFPKEVRKPQGDMNDVPAQSAGEADCAHEAGAVEGTGAVDNGQDEGSESESDDADLFVNNNRNYDDLIESDGDED